MRLKPIFDFFSKNTDAEDRKLGAEAIAAINANDAGKLSRMVVFSKLDISRPYDTPIGAQYLHMYALQKGKEECAISLIKGGAPSVMTNTPIGVSDREIAASAGMTRAAALMAKRKLPFKEILRQLT